MIERALSIRQPWAWAILHSGKDVENRQWSNYARNLRPQGLVGGDEVYIHASKRPGATQWRRDVEEFVEFCTERRIVLPSAFDDWSVAYGGIVGAARIVDIRPNGDAPSNPWAIAGCLGLVLADVRPVPFVACKGALGFWRVPADVLAKLEGRAA